MRKIQFIFLVIFLISSAFSMRLTTNYWNFSPLEKTKLTKQEESGIQWLTLDEALKQHEKEPRMWVVDLYTDWCGWCKKMDKTTFSDPIIGAFVNQNYYAVKFNAEQKEDVVVGKKTYKFIKKGQRGYHEFAAELMQGKMSYPTVVFLDKEKQVLAPVPGYQTKEDFLPIVQFIHSYDPTAPISFEDYKNSFKSPY